MREAAAGSVPETEGPRTGSPSRVVVHAGFRKAGSTSTQALLRKNRAALAPHLWLSVREAPTKPFRDRAMRYVRSRDPAWIAKLRTAAGELRAAAEGAEGRVALISDENLFGNAVYHADGSTIFDWAAELLPLIEEAFADVALEFHFQTRPSESWLRSTYNQEVRNNRCTQSYEEWRAQVPAGFDWEEGCRRIAAALHAPATFVEMQTELAEHGLLGHDLLRRAGLSEAFIGELERPDRANTGFDEWIVDFMRDVNRSSLSSSQVREVIGLLKKHRTAFETK